LTMSINEFIMNIKNYFELFISGTADRSIVQDSVCKR
jgi:hypothetical protein